MVIRTRTISFTADRTPSMRKIRLGYETDNLVERLEFILPEISASQTATLRMGGEQADVVNLAAGDNGRYYVDLTREIVGPDGEREAIIQIDGADGEAWHSVLRLVTGALPDVDEEIEQRFPSAVETMLAAMAEHAGEMDEQAERIEGAARRAEAAAERAENAGGSGGSGGVQTVNGKAPDDNGNIEVREVPGGAGSYQQLVTGADGVAKWEANPLYKTDRLTLKLSPAFDKAGSSGKYIGCAATNDAAQRAIAVEIGGEILKKAEYNKSGYTFYWDGVKYVASFRALPFVWTKGSSIGMKDGSTPFPFDATCVSANGGANLNITYDDGQDHTFEWILAEPKAMPLDEEWIPNTVPVIQTAEAGQVVTVKSVDENGRPTGWEATNTDNLKGDPGEPGRDGQNGSPGKTAYQYAQDGGYTGTEAEFAAKLAEELPEPYTLPVATADRLGGVMVGKGLVMDGEALGVEPDNKYEMVERITLGYEQLTEKPDDWDTNKTSYFWFEDKTISPVTTQNWSADGVFFKSVDYQEVSGLIRNVMPDGTPYNLKRVFIRVFTPKHPQVSSSTSVNYSFGNTMTMTAAHLANNDRYGIVEAWVENGMMRANAADSSGKWNTCNLNTAAYYRQMHKADAITEVKIQVPGNPAAPLLHGSIFEIWGVRAK